VSHGHGGAGSVFPGFLAAVGAQACRPAGTGFLRSRGAGVTASENGASGGETAGAGSLKTRCSFEVRDAEVQPAVL